MTTPTTHPSARPSSSGRVPLGRRVRASLAAVAACAALLVWTPVRTPEGWAPDVRTTDVRTTNAQVQRLDGSAS